MQQSKIDEFNKNKELFLQKHSLEAVFGNWKAGLLTCEEDYLHREIAMKAAKLHDGQFRDDGEPYYNHLLRVASNFHSYTPMVMVAFFHDAIEDNKITSDKMKEVIVEIFSCSIEWKDQGYEEAVFGALEIMCRRKDEDYFDYIQRYAIATEETPKDVVKRFFACLGKASDLNDNMRDSKKGSRRDKYRFAKQAILNSQFKDVLDFCVDGRITTDMIVVINGASYKCALDDFQLA